MLPSLAIVGGGRWARIWFGVTARRGTPAGHWVSARNAAGVRQWLRATTGAEARHVRVYSSLEPVLAAVPPGLAIVANLPSEHGPAVRRFLEHGWHVLVEKPFVPTAREALELSALAATQGVVLAVGLELMWATYVEAFADHLARRHVQPDAVEVLWHDLYSELRSAVPKTPDLTTSVASDLLPHVLSVLTVACGAASTRVDRLVLRQGGLHVDMRLRYGRVPATVSLSRVANRTRRLVRVRAKTGTWHTLDFSEEPGVILTADGPQCRDPHWASGGPPLARLLDAVVRRTTDENHALRVLARDTLHIVEATEQAAHAVRREQVARLRVCLRQGIERLDRDDHAVLRELLAGSVLGDGLVQNPKDQAALDRVTRRAWRGLRSMARPGCDATDGGRGHATGAIRRLLSRCDWLPDLVESRCRE